MICPYCQKRIGDEATPKERQIILLLAEGLTHAQIAEKLQVSPRTIGVHLYNLHKKWNVEKANSVKLIREAIRRGVMAYEGDIAVERPGSVDNA